MFYRPALHFAVEAAQKFGPNVVGFQLATGGGAVLHRGVLTLPILNLDNRECRRRAQGAP